jgi:hypothetical protein
MNTTIGQAILGQVPRVLKLSSSGRACRYSPFVVHLKPAITQLAKEYQEKGVKVAMCFICIDVMM